MNDNNDLSEREQEILKLVATGASNKEIANRLNISTNTVKVHLRNIFGKIGASSRTEAAMYAVNIGLVQNVGRIQEDYPVGNGSLATNQAPARIKLSLWITIFFVVIILGLLGTTSYLVWKGTRSVIANLQPTSEPVWQENAPMPTPRYGLATAVYENFIYAIAGETGDTVSGRVERYDPSTNSWRTLKEKPTAVSDVSAVVLGGKIYIPGGRLASGSMTDILEIYDPRLDTWSIGASLPISLSAYALASFEGKLYLFGGWDGKSYLATTYEYDPEKDLWTPEPDLPTPRAYAGAAVAGRKIYVFGGYNGKEALAANEAFLPDRSDDPAQAWETATPMPTAGYAMGVSGVADSIYIVGGLGNTNQPIREMYLFQNGEWNSLESYPQLVGSNLGLIDLSTYLYAIGGIIRKKPSDANLSYKALYTISVPIISK